MSTKTNHLNLIKPELTDAADITAMNENWDKIDQEFYKSHRIVVATKGDDSVTGVTTYNNYTATVEGLTELYNGLEITVIPDVTSTSLHVKLDVNGLGATSVRMTLPFSSGNSGATATTKGWFSANAPMKLRYHEAMNCWKSDLQRQSAQALYGCVPVESGGTGADNSDDALANLGIDKTALLRCDGFSGSLYQVPNSGDPIYLNPTKEVGHIYTTLEMWNTKPVYVACCQVNASAFDESGYAQIDDIYFNALFNHETQYCNIVEMNAVCATTSDRQTWHTLSTMGFISIDPINNSMSINVGENQVDGVVNVTVKFYIEDKQS